MARSRPVFSRCYDLLSRATEERAGIAAHRAELLAGVTGRVLEVGAGTGLNFTHYPPGTEHVLALEPEPHLRSRAAAAAAAAPVPVSVAAGVAEALPVADGSADVVVFSLVLCSVRDQAGALAEARRALRPGGELRFYEHVLAQTRGLARFQRAADHVWPVFAGGCHTARDTPAAVAAAGFAVEEIRRFDLGGALAGPVRPHAIGRARRPL